MITLITGETYTIELVVENGTDSFIIVRESGTGIKIKIELATYMGFKSPQYNTYVTKDEEIYFPKSFQVIQSKLSKYKIEGRPVISYIINPKF